MNDPLRDNRIFPEEMQQQAVVQKKSLNTTWLLNAIGIILVLVLVYFAYTLFLKKKPLPVETTVTQEFQEQLEIYRNIRQITTVNTPELREKKIQMFLGTE